MKLRVLMIFLLFSLLLAGCDSDGKTTDPFNQIPDDPFDYYPTLTPAPPTATVEPTPSPTAEPTEILQKVPLYRFIPLNPGPEFFSYMEQVAKTDYSPGVVDPRTDSIPDIPGYGRVFSTNRYSQVLYGMPGGDLNIGFCTSLAPDISNPISFSGQEYDFGGDTGQLTTIECIFGYPLELDTQSVQADFGPANIYLGQLPDGQTYAIAIPHESVPEQGNLSMFLVDGNRFVGDAAQDYTDIVSYLFGAEQMPTVDTAGVTPAPTGSPIGEYPITAQP